MKKSLLAVCLSMAALTALSPAQGAELKVLVAQVVEPSVRELVAQFEKSTGNKLNVEYGFGVEQNKRVQAGEAADVVIFPNGLINTPETQAVLAPKTTTELLRIGQGIAVKKGAPKPEVSTAEALKQTLLKAKSVAFVPTGQTGVATLAVFAKLGIAEEMKAKTKVVKAEEVVPAVANGEVELAIFLNHYLVGVEGIDYVGPYPGDLQSYIAFSAGQGAKSGNAEAATAFIKFLSAAAAAPVMKKHGMDPA
jgi:molybdate transport system substrate-binding protein